MTLRFPPRRLHREIRAALASLPAPPQGGSLPPEQVIAVVHRRLRAAFPGQVAVDLRWSVVSAAFGTQTVAPLSVGIGEYLAITGTPLPTGGETGAFLADIDDHVIFGEIETASAHRQQADRFGPGMVSCLPVRSSCSFAVREQVWMVEHVRGIVPTMFTLPVMAALLATLNLRSLFGLMRDSLRVALGRDQPDEDGVPWENWLGNQRARPAAIRRPNNRWEVREIVDEVRAHNAAHPDEAWRIRCFGTRHSWSRLVPTRGVMLDMTAMSDVLAVDVDRRRITVEPGLLLETLIARAWDEGWRVRSVTALKQITVGGMLSVGAHGNDTSAATFSDDVVALTLVDGQGQLRHIDEAELETLRGAQIGLGALGVIVSLTVQCHESGLWEYRCDALRHADVATQAQIDAIVAANDMVEIYWFPGIDRVQVLRWNEVDEASPPPFLRRYDWRDRMRSWLIQNVGQFLVGSPVAWFVDRVRPRAAWMLVWLSSRMFSREETLQSPTDAGHYLYAYHKVRDAGWAVPAARAAQALAVYAETIARYRAEGRYPVNICVHLRFIRPGSALLGFDQPEAAPPAGAEAGAAPLICQIEAAMTKRADAATRFLQEIELRFISPEFKGRPHWAKEWWVRFHPFALGGQESWPKFRALRQDFDPDDLFANRLVRDIDGHVDEIHRLLSEPADGGRGLTLDEIRDLIIDESRGAAGRPLDDATADEDELPRGGARAGR